MTTNVTVLGGNGTTLTVAFASALAASFAQTSLIATDADVNNGSLTFVTYAGGSVPAPAQGTFFGAYITGATAPAPFSLPAGYLAMVVNASVPVFFNDAPGANQTVVSGQGGVVMNNVGAGASIFLGGGANVFNEANAAASASITLGAVGYFDTSQGSTSITATDGSLAVLAPTQNGGTAAITVPSGNVVVEVGGSATVPVSISSFRGNVAYLPNGGAASITGQVTVYGANAAFGTSGLGSETVQGTGGNMVVSNGNGLFIGGEASDYVGNNTLITSTIPGAATLIGGSYGDTLSAQAAGDVLIAGWGSETLRSFAQGGGSFSGSNVAVLQTGQISFLDSIDIVTGGYGGGNSFVLGDGLMAMTGNHATVAALAGAATVAGAMTVPGIATITGSGTIPGGVSTIAGATSVPGGFAVQAPGGAFYAAGSANTYSDRIPGQFGGGINIVGDFVPGLDRMVLVNGTNAPTLTSIVYYAAGVAGSPFSAGNTGTYVTLSDNTRIEFYNAALSTSDFG